MRVAGQWVFIVVYALSLIGLGPVERGAAAPDAQIAAQIAPRFAVSSLGKAQTAAATLSWTGPLACPPGGCAGGQTVSLRFFYAPQSLPATGTNLMVCLYAPGGWVDATTAASAMVASAGINSGATYAKQPDTAECDRTTNLPAGMKVVLKATAALTAASSDALDMAFRLAPGATGINSVSAKMLVADGAGNWPAQQSAFSSTLQVYAPSAVTLAYVANDAAACGFYQPCYINSGVDLPGGFGTGLKDAVDSLASSTGGSNIELLGSYTVKSNTVVVDKAASISALGSATLTYNDLKNCGAPMLSLNNAVTLHDLTINDGGCPPPHRDLVYVNSQNQDVTIQSNTLTGGKDAITIDKTTTGAVTVRFNQITGNAGNSVSYQGDGTTGGPLYVTANNLTAVQCAASGSGPTAAKRYANHNYWSAGLPNIAATRCSIDASRQLGLPIATLPNAPGVNAVSAAVPTGDPTHAASVMNDQVLFYRHSGDNPFSIYVVDHGYLTAGGPPFSANQGFNPPMPCSNYWDVFLDETSLGATPAGTLELLLRYGKGSQDQCVTTINSAKFCDQTTTRAAYPLYWLDPSALSAGWITTGASGGQPTACDTGRQLVQVSINASTAAKPNLTNNLGYTPLMVGVPVLRYFTASASNNLVTITWASNVEPNISGYYLLRGTDPSHLSPISGLIANQGNLNSGYTYPAIYDNNRVNGQKYYYQLQIVRSDGTVFYSNLQSTTGTSATATITPTPTATPLTPTWTPYPTSTPRPTYIPTRAPTQYVPYRSPTPTAPTWTPAPTLPLLDTLTATPDLGTPGAVDTLTAEALAALQTATASALPATATPSPTLTPTPQVAASTAHPWLSLLFGILAGLLAVGSAAGAWYYLRIRK